MNFMSEQEIYCEGMTVESIMFNPSFAFDPRPLQSHKVGIIKLFYQALNPGSCMLTSCLTG